MLLSPTLLTLVLSAASLVHGSDPADREGTQSLTPPGLLELNGGTTVVGSTPKEIQALVDSIPGAASALRVLDAETPQRRIAVPRFYYGVTEVTHEQYAAFVAATSYRPPHLWGAAAIDLARRTYLEEQGRLRKEAHDAGEKLPEMIPFDPEEWWSQNWSDCEWEVPTKLAQSPVTFVDYQDARAYARWAGMRLMSEIHLM